MNVISNKDVIRIIRNTLDLIDPRLMMHGGRVSYIMYKMLQYENEYSEREVIDFCAIAMLHDIGAYKTEEIDNMIKFETGSVWDHSIYGYLFIKYCSPLHKLADALLFHHLDYNKFPNFTCENKKIANMLHLADRIDMLIRHNILQVDEELLNPMRDTKFDSDHIDTFLQADKKYGIIQHITNDSYRDDIEDLFNRALFSDHEIQEYLQLLALSIDFRSEHTVTHTITTVNIACELAKRMNLDENEIHKIHYGALLHDLGKVAIPHSILEKPGALEHEEYQIMKTHVSITGDILEGFLNQEIYEIAVRHHEKLNGKGYPRGLTGEELTTNQRIVAVADITSALVGVRSYKKSFDKEKVLAILSTAVENNEICPAVTELLIKDYDDIVSFSLEQCDLALSAYYRMKDEYLHLRDELPKAEATKL